MVKPACSAAVRVLGADRAGPTSLATVAHAIRAGRAPEMICARGDIIAAGENAPAGQALRHRRSRQDHTGLTFAPVRECPAPPEPERAAIAVPESVTRMDQEADRRGMHRPRATRPLLEWENRAARRKGRALFREGRAPGLRSPDGSSGRGDGRARRPLRRSLRTRPSLPVRPSRKDNCANIRQFAAPFAVFEQHRAARDETGLLDGGEDFVIVIGPSGRSGNEGQFGPGSPRSLRPQRLHPGSALPSIHSRKAPPAAET